MTSNNEEMHILYPDQYLVYTDGACSGNPGPGGWGAIIVTPGETVQQRQVKELGSGEIGTTNNRMEVSAALIALEQIPAGSSVMIFTDSTYLIRGITQWAYAWKRRGWITAEGNPVTNKDLFEQLIRVVVGKKIQWNYVRGHKGYPGNERCDEIAVAFSKNSRISMYRGSLEGYRVEVLDLPDFEALPEMKPKTEKKAAHCYLSYVGGVITEHPDWASCEKAVKGRSGAKFKKAMTADEIDEIKKSWGL